MYGYKSIDSEYLRMKDVAKIIDIKGYGTVNIFKLLRAKEVLDDCNQPKEDYIRLGYFKSVTNIVPIHTRKIVKYGSCRVSRDGIEFIRALISRCI